MQWKKFVLETVIDNILVNCQIKTWDECVAKVKLLLEKKSKKAQCLRTSIKYINGLYTELKHPSEEITQITGKAMDLQLSGTYKTCKDCAVGKAVAQ